jgi:sulfur carrier protein ThiS
MSTPIELHAYMQMADFFRERQWPNPGALEIAGELTGPQLLAQLGIAQEKVEVMFVNRKAYAADIAVIHPGDRVALVPPGVPGPHRFLLGFKNRS